MADEQSPKHHEHQRDQHHDLASPELEGSQALDNTSAYHASLLGDPRLSGRGNAPVRISLMRQLQQTYGNRAVQRYLQRSKSAATHEDERADLIEEHAQAEQHDITPGEPLAASNFEAGNPANGPDAHEAASVGTVESAALGAIQRTPSAALTLRNSMRSTPWASMSIQRDIKGSKNLSQGKFEIDFTKTEGAMAGDVASEGGTVTFTPKATAPASKSIRIIQIVRTVDTSGAVAKDYDWTGSAEAARNKQFTTEDKAKGIKGGFYVDQQAAFLAKRTKKSDAPVPPYYDAAGPPIAGNQIGKRQGKTIVPAILDDTPGFSGPLKYIFETVAKAEDTGISYGAVLWGFEIYLDKAGVAKIKGENKDFKETPSRTVGAALKKFNEYYRNPGASTAPTT
jgi:hypothetical protein